MHPCSFPWVYLEVSCSWFSWLCRKLRLGRDVNNFLSLYTVYGVYCSCASREKLKEKNKQDIVEHRLNEGPREWQNLLAITRFCYIEVLFLIFYYCWGKENRSLYRVLRYIEVRYIEVRCIEVRYIEVPLLYWSTWHYYYYFWARAQILPREKMGGEGGGRAGYTI